jgi:hypothetical protein
MKTTLFEDLGTTGLPSPHTQHFVDENTAGG